MKKGHILKGVYISTKIAQFHHEVWESIAFKPSPSRHLTFRHKMTAEPNRSPNCFPYIHGQTNIVIHLCFFYIYVFLSIMSMSFSCKKKHKWITILVCPCMYGKQFGLLFGSAVILCLKVRCLDGLGLKAMLSQTSWWNCAIFVLIYSPFNICPFFTDSRFYIRWAVCSTDGPHTGQAYSKSGCT